MCQESQTESGIRYPCCDKEHSFQKQQETNKKLGFHPVRAEDCKINHKCGSKKDEYNDYL